ncbi:MAG: DUF2029 domain-containing protein, partial [Candidatus Eisenbacteria bacterium]|nr:DUF2029 domain-containing protein [Candidatus Eisenbacteria bacterium]
MEKTALVCALCVGSLLAVWGPTLAILRRHIPLWLLCISGSLLRIGLFLWSSLFAAPQHADSYKFYYPQAKAALRAGQALFDVRTHYSPLFPYLASVSVRVYDSPASIVAMMVLCEIASLWLVLGLVRRCFDAEPAFRIVWLYALNPIPVYWSCVSGHNGALIHCFLLMAMLLFLRHRDQMSGLLMGTALAVTKCLVAVLHVPFLFVSRRSGRFALFAVGVPALLFLGAAVLNGRGGGG